MKDSCASRQVFKHRCNVLEFIMSVDFAPFRLVGVTR